MKCPNCQNNVKPQKKNGACLCPVCGQALPDLEPPKKAALRIARVAALWLAGIFLFSYAAYKIYYWVSDYRLVRLYTRGAYTPTVNAIELDDGRVGHAVIFYGSDGDQIFLPEVGYSVTIAGGTARFEFPDNQWFQDVNVSETEGANIVFSPILISQSGAQTALPNLEVAIDVPASPLTVLSPKEQGTTIYTSTYELSMEVVPGSAVSINGEDVTSSVDRAGELVLNVYVEPIGDNVYTMLVKTPSHRETRYDITIFRQALDIDVELDASVKMNSNNSTMMVTGTTEPGATITVDTQHIENSVSFNMETGEFSFIAEFESIGSNLVRFHASMEGRQDAALSFPVKYVPSLAQYSGAAWKMDYSQLRLLYEQWKGRIFKCDGRITDSFTDDGTTYWVMDVGTEGEQQLILLINDSSMDDISMGRSFSAYADVQGRHMYEAAYYPLLTARYMDTSSGT